MRIAIDLQSCQSAASGRRGIGRYSRSMALAMARRARDHQIILAVNGCYPESVDELKAAFDGLVDPRDIRVWYPPSHVHEMDSGAQRATEKIYEAFLAELQPDVVHLTSLFEGLGEPAVTSIGRFAPLPTAVTLYDLIPLIHSHQYLDNPAVRAWYMRKVSALQRAHTWLAISESSRQEGILHLGLRADKCINVSTAADSHFQRLELDADRQAAQRRRYGLNKPFVMYTGGIDRRKNLEGLIRAFALLPAELRSTHQLAIVCSARDEDREALLRLAHSEGLEDGTVVVTGFVPEGDLVELYNLCQLFVFPSWHEGFGLPALEAMHCGAVVIASDSSSVPEVIGRADALFDPHDDRAIAAKIVQGLTDNDFRRSLAEHGPKQARRFSWDESARRALDGLEALHASAGNTRSDGGVRGLRPRLAYLSPLPPERSGISHYSAELLPELARHYDIDLVSDLTALDDTVLAASFPLRGIDWFRQHAHEFDRVLYHFGNSEFHQELFTLLDEAPGVVVLHDFFLSGIQAHRELANGEAHAWTRALYDSHGYGAVAERFRADDCADVVFKYPCNFDVLRASQGVIVHSPYSRELAADWFGEDSCADWALIPLLRVLPGDTAGDRTRARQELGLSPDDVLVCAFGLLGPTKLNHRLVEAWLQSSLGSHPDCRLVFVGANDPTAYGDALSGRIAQAGAGARIEITGWANKELFHRYLAAADIAVQLRTKSRGETSASVLDTMSHGLATIVNANGSMAFLPKNALVMLPDEFSDAELTAALEMLWNDAPQRLALGIHGRKFVEEHHSPSAAAQRYADAIERFAATATLARDGLIQAIAASGPVLESGPRGNEAVAIAQTVAETLPQRNPKRQLLVDISELVQRDGRSGIQRVVKSLLNALLESPPEGFRVEPVYATVGGPLGYRYARKFTLAALGCPADALPDEPINAHRGDVFIGLDLQPQLVPQQRLFYWKLRNAGVRVEFVVYDLLPILLSRCFYEGAEATHTQWLQVVAENDGALCISQSVANELSAWIAANAPPRLAHGFQIRSFHLGADFEPSGTTIGLPPDAKNTLNTLRAGKTFLMVGTLEPRKGHAEVLDAFESLWHADPASKLTLVLVGKHGWLVDSLVARLDGHAESGRRLFWIPQASDEYLEQIYAVSSCLIVASEGEGFGLPLIEAARHRLPILARDLPVFKEVAGEHAYYFHGGSAALADAVGAWLELHRTGSNPSSNGMRYLTWDQSAEQFKAALGLNPTM